METDRTMPGMSGPHPTIAQLRNPTEPAIDEHVASCSMCQSVMAADGDDGTRSRWTFPRASSARPRSSGPPIRSRRGGMAQIFAGEDRRLGRTVILKTPRDDENLPAGMTDLFQRRVSAEARVLAKLQHPSIVTLYELGKASVGWPFCVLERVDGIALRDRLDELVRAGRARAASRARASASSCCRTSSRSPKRSRTRTSAASFIATSRRTTSSSVSAARRR